MQKNVNRNQFFVNKYPDFFAIISIYKENNKELKKNEKNYFVNACFIFDLYFLCT